MGIPLWSCETYIRFEVLKKAGLSCNRFQRKKIMILKNTALQLIILAFMASPAFATKTVTSPYVTKGKAAVEWRGGYEEDDGDNVFKTRNQFSYGFTDFYDLKVSVDTEHEDGDDDFTDVDFENKFQITPRGEYFVDLGLRLDYTRALDGGADEVGGKILLGKKTGEWSHLLNLEAGREVGEDSSDDWAYGFAYGVQHPVTETLALGGEWYSDFGDFSGDWDDEDHRAGPVLYGTAFGKLKYQAGILAGLSNSASDATVKATLNYGFSF